jgi:photosystem II stability/assembly factor-like uncharacterized protein
MEGGKMKKSALCVVAALFLLLLLVPAVQSGSFKASGVGWVQQSSGTTQDLRSVSAVDATTAWAVGANYTILKTTDGSTWNPQTMGIPITDDLYGVDALDSQYAFATGDTGLVTKTSNGTDWTTTTSPT